MSADGTGTDASAQGTAEELVPQPSVVDRVASLPLVSSTCDMVTGAYASTKESHPRVKTVCDAAEKGVRTLAAAAASGAQPILARLEPQSRWSPRPLAGSTGRPQTLPPAPGEATAPVVSLPLHSCIGQRVRPPGTGQAGGEFANPAAAHGEGAGGHQGSCVIQGVGGPGDGVQHCGQCQGLRGHAGDGGGGRHPRRRAERRGQDQVCGGQRRALRHGLPRGPDGAERGGHGARQVGGVGGQPPAHDGRRTGPHRHVPGGLRHGLGAAAAAGAELLRAPGLALREAAAARVRALGGQAARHQAEGAGGPGAAGAGAQPGGDHEPRSGPEAHRGAGAAAAAVRGLEPEAAAGPGGPGRTGAGGVAGAEHVPGRHPAAAVHLRLPGGQHPGAAQPGEGAGAAGPPPGGGPAGHLRRCPLLPGPVRQHPDPEPRACGQGPRGPGPHDRVRGPQQPRHVARGTFRPGNRGEGPRREGVG